MPTWPFRRRSTLQRPGSTATAPSPGRPAANLRLPARPGALRGATDHGCAPLLEAERMQREVGQPGQDLRRWREPEVRRTRCSPAEPVDELPIRGPCLDPGDLLLGDRRDHRFEHGVGSAEADPSGAPLKLANESVSRLEGLGMVGDTEEGGHALDRQRSAGSRQAHESHRRSARGRSLPARRVSVSPARPTCPRYGSSDRRSRGGAERASAPDRARNPAARSRQRPFVIDVVESGHLAEG